MDFDPGDESDSEKSRQSTPELLNSAENQPVRPQELKLEVIEEPANGIDYGNEASGIDPGNPGNLGNVSVPLQSPAMELCANIPRSRSLNSPLASTCHMDQYTGKR